MFGRRKHVQNRAVARHMRRFFRRLRPETRERHDVVAKEYALHIYNGLFRSGTIHIGFGQSLYDIGIASTDHSSLPQLTKRVALISDTLMLSHHWAGRYQELAVYQGPLMPEPDPELNDKDSRDRYNDSLENQDRIGMTCPDFNSLGRWVLNAEPLLTTGLAIYLPSYKKQATSVTRGKTTTRESAPGEELFERLVVNDRQVIDATGANPIHNSLVRPVLNIDLPFIDGLDLRQFGQITHDEFDSYTAFRDFLRLNFLELDEALDAVQSQRELAKIGLTIADQVRANHAEIAKVTTRRAVLATGAALGTVAATLVAVYGPALQTAIGTIGVTGGLWGVIQALADNNPRRARDATGWHYVWALSKTARRP